MSKQQIGEICVCVHVCVHVHVCVFILVERMVLSSGEMSPMGSSTLVN